MTHTRTAALTAIALAALLAGCGGGNDDSTDAASSTDDPVKVAIAYHKSWWRCGEEGTARRHDLRASTSQTRQEALQEDRRDGCSPTRPPEMFGVVAAEEGDQVAVTLRSPDASTMEPHQLILARLGGDWKVIDDGGRPTLDRPDPQGFDDSYRDYQEELEEGSKTGDDGSGFTP